MNTGISLICKRRFGQFLITQRPYCVINNMQTMTLEWDRSVVIPLIPDMPYQISIQFMYMGKPCGTALLRFTLRPGELGHYQYKSPFFMFSPGSVKRIG